MMGDLVLVGVLSICTNVFAWAWITPEWSLSARAFLMAGSVAVFTNCAIALNAARRR